MSKYVLDKKFYIEHIVVLEKEIYNFVVGKVDDRSVAEDLTQNTMEKAWKNLSQLRDRDKARSWLFSIAANEVKLYYRDHENLEFYDENDENGDVRAYKLNGEQADTLEVLIRKYDVLTMKEALSRLESKYRKLIVMRFAQGMNQKEIAELLGENYSTVRVNMVRALKKLGMLMDEIEKEVR